MPIVAAGQEPPRRTDQQSNIAVDGGTESAENGAYLAVFCSQMTCNVGGEALDARAVRAVPGPGGIGNQSGSTR